MPFADAMTAAYLEAAVFTDCGEEGQPPADAAFSPRAECQAWRVCRNFCAANRDELKDVDAAQCGHDLWLTRNGHGTGFWDRPEVYGTQRAWLFTRCAECLGEATLYQGDDGLLYFDEA